MDFVFRRNGGTSHLLQSITINNVAWVVKLDHFPQVVGVKKNKQIMIKTNIYHLTKVLTLLHEPVHITPAMEKQKQTTHLSNRHSENGYPP